VYLSAWQNLYIKKTIFMIWNGESILYFKSLKAINIISLEIALSILPNLRYTLLPCSVQFISHETMFFSHNKLVAASLSAIETISRIAYVWNVTESPDLTRFQGHLSSTRH
jgi:hypothetical protein